MNGQTILSFWQLVVVTLLPALIAGTVGVLSPVIVEWLKQRAERKRKRAENLDNLLRALYEYDHWLDLKKNSNAFGHEDRAEMTPRWRLQTLVAIHFPQFEKKTQTLVVKALNYEGWSIEAGRKRLAKIDKFTDGFREVYDPYREAFQDIVEDISKAGRKEFRS